MSQTGRHNFTVIRGDSQQLIVGLAEAWVEVLESPSDFIARLVLKDAPDDNLPARLTVNVTPEIVTPVPGDVQAPVLFTFTLSPAQTQSLPAWDLVGYVELRTTDDNYVNRLLDCRVTVKD